MLFKLDSNNPGSNRIRKIVDILRGGGIVIIPTDTIYSFACDLTRPKAYKELCRLKGKKDLKADFSIAFNDLSMLADYTLPMNSQSFKILKRTLPGPYTYILKASRKVPHLFGFNKKTIGIRIPDNQIPLQIVEQLGNPILLTSLRTGDEIIPHPTDPEIIFEAYKQKVDMVVHSGPGKLEGSSVIDLTSGEPEILREGLGDISLL